MACLKEEKGEQPRDEVKECQLHTRDDAIQLAGENGSSASRGKHQFKAHRILGSAGRDSARHGDQARYSYSRELPRAQTCPSAMSRTDQLTEISVALRSRGPMSIADIHNGVTSSAAITKSLPRRRS